MTKNEIINWVMENTSCYAEDGGATGILIDGTLYYHEIKELARMVEEL